MGEQHELSEYMNLLIENKYLDCRGMWAQLFRNIPPYSGAPLVPFVESTVFAWLNIFLLDANHYDNQCKHFLINFLQDLSNIHKSSTLMAEQFLRAVKA